MITKKRVCENCGCELKENETKCPICHHENQNTDFRECPYCHKMIPTVFQFCPSCGKNVGNVKKSPQEEPKPKYVDSFVKHGQPQQIRNTVREQNQDQTEAIEYVRAAKSESDSLLRRESDVYNKTDPMQTSGRTYRENLPEEPLNPGSQQYRQPQKDIVQRKRPPQGDMVQTEMLAPAEMERWIIFLEENEQKLRLINTAQTNKEMGSKSQKIPDKSTRKKFLGLF